MDPTAQRLVAILHELIDIDELEEVLRRVLTAARELTGARYAAVGVLNDERDALARFLTVGIEEEQREVIGGLPHGRGVLGELIEQPRVLRVADVSRHPRSYGFPLGHPLMYAATAINHARRFDRLESRRHELERTVAALGATGEISRALAGGGRPRADRQAWARPGGGTGAGHPAARPRRAPCRPCGRRGARGRRGPDGATSARPRSTTWG